MSNDWYNRQFGSRDDFAVTISLGRDPHPTGDAKIDAGWGGLSMWVRGRCLTRSKSSDGGVCDEVRWNLVEMLKWLIDVSVPLVNEEPFPIVPWLDQVRDACDWVNGTATPLLTLTEEEADEWFLQRSDWCERHKLTRAALDVALPQVIIRRLGDFLEVSWDNVTCSAPRPDISFVEQRGRELVKAAGVAADIGEALRVVTEALAEKYPFDDLKDLARAAREKRATEGDWKWLVHQPTATIIQREMASLRDRLTRHARKHSNGFFVPHTQETLLLRNARLISEEEITALLSAGGVKSKKPMSESIRKQVRPLPALTDSPWEEGYRRAAEVREAFGWGDGPTPPLQEWMEGNHISVQKQNLSSAIDLVTIRMADYRASAVVNPRVQSRVRREIGIATALGHLLCDSSGTAVDGTWEHRPTAARARAFAAMLLLPSQGIRAVLAGKSSVDAADVDRLMQTFHTGPHATTYHLKNLGLLDEDRRSDILRELAA